MTKHLISEAGGINTYFLIQDLTNPSHCGWKHIKISTTYDHSRDPDYEQTKVEMCLDPEAFASLKAVINSL
jgi:hypothetical protein